MKRTLLPSVAFLLAVLAVCAHAHEVRPAYLELRQTGPETYDVLWKVPARADLRLGIYVRLPEHCRNVTPPTGDHAADAFIERWTATCKGGMSGGRVLIEGLSATLTDVLVRGERLDGMAQVVRLKPSSPSFVVEAASHWTRLAGTYLRLGVAHILLGFDHLLFVLGLLVLAGRRWMLMCKTVSAFTVAHSLTLGAATLGVVRVPAEPLNAVIALSILFVGVEIARQRRGEIGITTEHPWGVAFGFGLLHGFGNPYTLRVRAYACGWAALESRVPELSPGFGAPVSGMGFCGWYGEARASTPPGVYQYDVVTIETTLWDMQPERVIWAGTGEAVDPKNVTTLAGELAEVLIAKMRQSGIL